MDKIGKSKLLLAPAPSPTPCRWSASVVISAFTVPRPLVYDPRYPKSSCTNAPYDDHELALHRHCRTSPVPRRRHVLRCWRYLRKNPSLKWNRTRVFCSPLNKLLLISRLARQRQVKLYCNSSIRANTNPFVYPLFYKCQTTLQPPQRLRLISTKENDPNIALRVAVESGGCHGYQYKMELTSTTQPDD